MVWSFKKIIWDIPGIVWILGILCFLKAENCQNWRYRHFIFWALAQLIMYNVCKGKYFLYSLKGFVSLLIWWKKLIIRLFKKFAYDVKKMIKKVKNSCGIDLEIRSVFSLQRRPAGQCCSDICRQCGDFKFLMAILINYWRQFFYQNFKWYFKNYLRIIYDGFFMLCFITNHS